MSEGASLEAAGVKSCQALTVGMSTFVEALGGLGARGPSPAAGRLASSLHFAQSAFKNVLHDLYEFNPDFLSSKVQSDAASRDEPSGTQAMSLWLIGVRSLHLAGAALKK